MASFTIHIAVAKNIIKKNKNEIKDYKDFIDGTIAPDLSTDKNISHYGIWNKQ